MSKIRVCVVVASRANYGRIKSFMRAVVEHSELELDLVLAASALLYRFGSIESRIEDDGFFVNHKIYSVVDGENHLTMVKSTSLLMTELCSYFEQSNPDFVLTVADRHETLATAVAASYMNIPLLHTQGGEITGSIDDKVRHAITRLANYHFVATKQSYEFLLKMGESPDTVFHTGCPALDLLYDLDYSPDSVSEPEKGSGASISFDEEFALIVYHPVTDNSDEALKCLHSLTSYVIEKGRKTIWLWPNVDAGSDIISKYLRTLRDSSPAFRNLVRFVRSYSPEDYARILKLSKIVIGNSSSFIRECSFLGTPAILLGNRQRSRERGDNVFTLDSPIFSSQDILEAETTLASRKITENSTLYTTGNAGKIIANIIPNLERSTEKAPIYEHFHTLN